MKDYNPPDCPLCGVPVMIRTAVSCYRRSDRSVDVETLFWECASGCPDPDDERPFRFHDIQLLRANDEAAKITWRKAFGTEMPGSHFSAKG